MKASEHRVSIDDQLRAFLESGVSVLVGTRDSGLNPEITRAWGPRVSRDRTSIRLCVPLTTSRKTLENLKENGQIAVSFSLPTTYKTIQLKGHYIETVKPNATDLRAVERHREAFCSLNEGLGVERHLLDSFWRAELATSPILVAIRFHPEEIFDQTPGPKAGSRL
jgi:Pyridoxamine 5'-phosphate oxidase